MRERFRGWPAGRGALKVTAATLALGLSSAVAIAAPPAFGPTQNLPAGDNPNGIAVADFNNDGRMDAAVTDFDGLGSGPSASDGYGVSIFFADTEGDLVFDQKIALDNQPDQIVAAPISGGKGDSDLLVGTLTGEVIYLEGKAGISFGLPETIDAGGNSPRNLTYADFTGDGRGDIVVGRQTDGALALIRGLDGGGWAAPKPFGKGQVPVAIKLNSDKRMDLVARTASGKVKALAARKGPKPFKQVSTFAAGPEPSEINVGDFNRDRRVDLAVVDAALSGQRNVVSVLRGRGGGRFSKAQQVTVSRPMMKVARRGLPGDFPTSGVASDLNSNGRTDLAVVLRSGPIVVLDNTTAKRAKRFQFSRAAELDGGDEPDDIAAPLLGGDSKRDLAWTGDDGIYWANQN